MAIELEFPQTEKFRLALSRVDRFRVDWVSGSRPPSDRLAEMERVARIRSIASSSRLSGLRLTDTEVEEILRGETDGDPIRRELHGYEAGLRYPLPDAETLLRSEDLRRLHSVLLGGAEDGSEPSQWRTEPHHREAFDENGRATGVVFPTLPPRLVRSATEDLVTWFEFEIRSSERHPLLVIAAFDLGLLAISPFPRGNARLSRILLGHLMERAGFG